MLTDEERNAIGDRLVLIEKKIYKTRGEILIALRSEDLRPDTWQNLKRQVVDIKNELWDIEGFCDTFDSISRKIEEINKRFMPKEESND